MVRALSTATTESVRLVMTLTERSGTFSLPRESCLGVWGSFFFLSLDHTARCVLRLDERSMQGQGVAKTMVEDGVTREVEGVRNLFSGRGRIWELAD